MRNVSNLGHVLAREGRFHEALGPLIESVLLVYEQHDLFGLAAQLEDLAGAAAGLGRCVDAAVMLGGAEALRERTGNPVTPAFGEWREEILSRVRSELDAVRLSECWRRGSGLSADELVAYARDVVHAA